MRREREAHSYHNVVGVELPLEALGPMARLGRRRRLELRRLGTHQRFRLAALLARRSLLGTQRSCGLIVVFPLCVFFVND